MIAVGVFLALGGGDDEPDTAAAGGGSGVSPVATTGPLAEASAEIPTLVICPDGPYLDAETEETHVCPPPPN